MACRLSSRCRDGATLVHVDAGVAEVDVLAAMRGWTPVQVGGVPSGVRVFLGGPDLLVDVDGVRAASFARPGNALLDALGYAAQVALGEATRRTA